MYVCALKNADMLSENAIKYALRHLFAVAIPTDEDLDFTFEVENERLHIVFADDCRIDLALFSDEEREAFLNGEASPTLLASADKNIQIPVFTPQSALGTRLDGQYAQRLLNIPYDLVTPSFALLSREEEYRGLPRDEHNRFLFAYSLTRRYDCISFPLVDEYAMLLRQWISDYLKPNITIRPRAFRFIPTHDIDILHRFTGGFQAYKSIYGRDLLINHSLGDVRKSLQEYRDWKDDHLKDPYISAIQELIQLSQQHHLSSIFFFKAIVPEESDCTYDITGEDVRFAIQQIRNAGMEVGLHGSYNSYNDSACYLKEMSRLEQVIGARVASGRQHYLRFSLQRNIFSYQNRSIYTTQEVASSQVSHQNTLQVWQEAGLQHDYTLGYAEQPGFRCGTCHPYPLYDLDNDEPTDIVEHPLIVMDGSLFDYLKLGIADSNQLIDRLLGRCRAVEGDFVILWHNHLLSRNYRSRFEEVYVHLLRNS